jgi:hypothetical protein
MDSPHSVFEWFEHREGRASDRCRRLTFSLLFEENGRPGYWLLAVALLGAIVTGVALGA